MTQSADPIRTLTSIVTLLLDDETTISNARIAEVLDHEAQLRGIALSAEQRSLILASLETVFNVWIGEEQTLEDATNHIPWLPAKRAGIDWTLYERYRAYLHREHWPRVVLKRLDDLSEHLLSLLEDPERPGIWDRRGMVVGQVQSGKTANYTALTNRALDAGYRLVIILAGRFNDLRSQTQQRIDEGVLGYDTMTVRPGASEVGQRLGVGKLRGVAHRRVNSLTNSSQTGDFRKNVGGGIRPGRDPLVMVVKKQKSVLTNLLDWCNSLEPMPVLIIDDEADDSSVNTRKIYDENGNIDPELEPTAINGLIRKILMAFDRRCYVAYTATPFANIFISRDNDTLDHGPDLFPRSFIISLPAPDNYTGPASVFGIPDDEMLGPGQKRLDLVRETDDWQAWMPDRHRKEWRPPTEALPPTLLNAIRGFILATAARRARGQGTKHSSMLIHVTRFKWVQAHVHEQVSDEVNELRSRLRYEPPDGPLRQEFRQLWESEYAPHLTDRLTWEQVDAVLNQAAGEVETRMINGDARDSLQYLEHEQNGLKVIAIGGDKLSRGLTLEGLSTSYYLRAAGAYDTLLQMGRWFGYRPGYLDLCRIHTTSDLAEHYAHVTLASEELRRQFEEMAERGMTPEEFGLMVRTHPSLTITARNKMRAGTPLKLSFADSLSEQVTFTQDAQAEVRNRAAAEQLLRTSGTPMRDGERGNLTWRDVPASAVQAFLGSYTVPRASYKMVPAVLLRYINQRVADDRLTTWTVVVISNSRTASRDTLAGHDVGITQRETLAVRAEHSSVRRLLSPPDEGLDLTEHQQNLCRAPRLGRGGRETTAFSPHKARAQRPSERGLLLIYDLNLTMNDGKDTVEPSPAMGIALSFPPDDRAQAVDYLANETYWTTDMGSDQ